MKIIERILLAQDFSKSSENLVATAMELAKIFNCEVVPMHVLPDNLTNEKVKLLLQEAAAKKLQETAKKLNAEDVKTGDTVLAFGSISEEIVEAAVNVNANFILTGSGDTQKGQKFLLGTTTKRVIQKSEKPVFVIKENVPLNVQHILCPVDFSTTSKRSLKNAITMAHRFKAELTILSVCESQSSGWFWSEKESTLVNDDACSGHKAKFESFLEGINLSGLQYNKEIRKGNPAEEILNTISEKMIDLLVMGTTGKTGLNRLIIGSVTEKVVREVPCSFITLKSEDAITLQLEKNIQNIESHYNAGKQLMEDGFFEESIEQFKLCLSINNMHVPSHYGIAKVYEKINEPEKAKTYKNSAREILNRIWDQKIEEEVRKFRNY